jgi:hypothetical protein
MTEWWTYRLSDFLLFAPRTYYRLVELHNMDVWPAQLAAAATALLLLLLAWRGGEQAGRAAAAVLAAAWAFIAWRFHWHQYATINWAAVYFAGAFAVQALLLAGAGAAGALRFGPVTPGQRAAGAAVATTALALQPALALGLGRPWAQVEVVGVAPDPTAVFTLGVLLLARRAPWWLFPVPVVWCLVSGMTLWAMGAMDAFVLPLAAGATIVAAFATRSRVR